jgi:hypothetical protein
MRKLLLGLIVMVTAAASIVTVGAPTAAGEQESQPFFAVGTVSQRDVSTFQLNPVSSTSASAQPYVTADGLQILVRPDTGYYYKNPNSTHYSRGSYDGSTGAPATVVVGDQVRVYGRRVSSQFVAQYVWNPPPTTSSNPNVNPLCTGDLDPNDPNAAEFLNTSSGIRNAAFNIKGTVASNRAFLPCTGFGGINGGFRMTDIIDPLSIRADVAEAIAAYGGRPSIFVTAATQYYLGHGRSDWNHVIKNGNAVRTLGRYQRVSNGWIFVAKIVWSPPPEGGDTLNPSVDVNPAQTSPGHFEGPNTGGTAFGPPNGRFQADVVWTPSGPTDWTVSGTWILINNATGDPNGPEVLRGTLDGFTQGIDIELNLDVTSGEGRWFNAVGSGDLEGSISPTLPGSSPTAFTGRMRLSVVTPS